MRDLPSVPTSTIEAPPRSRFPRISPWWYLVFAFLAVVGLYASRQILLVREGIVRTDNRLERLEGRLAQIPPLSDSEITALRQSLNDTHTREAEARGISPVLRRNRLLRVARQEGLVRIESTPRYRVLDATYSVPLATHGVRRALDSLSARFWADLDRRALPGFRFTISSMLRSAEDQAALQGINVNAAQGTSSHEYGTTFDITYRQFSYRDGPEPARLRLPDGLAPVVRGYFRRYLRRKRADEYRRMAMEHAPRLAAQLGRNLIELEREGVLVVLRERRQPVYHVTSTLDDAPSGVSEL